MSESHEWLEVPFSPDLIEVEKKRVITWKQNFTADNSTRWIGRIGESAFRTVLNHLKIPYIDHTILGPSPIDFTTCNRKIDVKTVGTGYYPKKEYGCNITPRQHFRDQEADTYVFARYIEPQCLAVLVGWIEKEEFEKNCLTHLPGARVNGNFVIKEEMMELEISYLHPMESLWREFML